MLEVNWSRNHITFCCIFRLSSSSFCNCNSVSAAFRSSRSFSFALANSALSFSFSCFCCAISLSLCFLRSTISCRRACCCAHSSFLLSCSNKQQTDVLFVKFVTLPSSTLCSGVSPVHSLPQQRLPLRLSRQVFSAVLPENIFRKKTEQIMSTSHAFKKTFFSVATNKLTGLQIYHDNA